jgi:hypothetical protein
MMDENLHELAALFICDTNIDETNDGLIDFIALILQSPVSVRAKLHSQQDHHED